MQTLSCYETMEQPLRSKNTFLILQVVEASLRLALLLNGRSGDTSDRLKLETRNWNELDPNLVTWILLSTVPKKG
jgi:hypothetical protein